VAEARGEGRGGASGAAAVGAAPVGAGVVVAGAIRGAGDFGRGAGVAGIGGFAAAAAVAGASDVAGAAALRSCCARRARDVLGCTAGAGCAFEGSLRVGRVIGVKGGAKWRDRTAIVADFARYRRRAAALAGVVAGTAAPCLCRDTASRRFFNDRGRTSRVDRTPDGGEGCGRAFSVD